MSELTQTVQLFTQGKTERTRKTYQSIGKSFEVYLTEKRLSLKELQPIHVKELIYQQNAMNSKATYKKFLKALFNFIGRHDLVEYIKTGLKEVKEEQRFKVDLTLKEVSRLIDVTKQVHYKFAWSLMCFDGLRPGEVLGLDFNDVDLGKRLIILKKREGARYGPKGMKPIDKPESLRINALSLALFKQIPKGRGRVIPWSYKTLRKWFGRYVAIASITREDYPITMHKLRHFFGHIWVKQKRNIRILKELMRHSKLEYTLLYTEPSDTEIKEEFEEFEKQLGEEWRKC